ncbi:hypothetical protein BDV59DRAFT_199181 [Aspergillus ambiguus]|uniref:uncharacterized protein n=1 Tax=Aspergillus ambiguus TaxID=176160 RepID=UPI003CCCB1FB
MVVFVDLDHDAFNKHHFSGARDSFLHPFAESGNTTLSKLKGIASGPSTRPADADDGVPADPICDPPLLPSPQKMPPNQNAFSAALSCYPVVKEIARSVDLNTLHALSRTCRQFHANLAPYRQQLAKQTLRCENEYIETLSDLLGSGAAISDSVKSVIQLLSRGATTSGRLTSGKVAKCARDMVAECRRCSKVVCRNCIAKPVTSSMFKNRIRRLCTTCREAPLTDLLTPTPSDPTNEGDSFTASAFFRSPCSCQSAVWLCHQCGQKLRSSDTTYRRVWSWRTRYSTYLGGLGTGIGEGCQGVKCGRGEDCLAAQEIELEVECEADESASSSPAQPHVGFGHRLAGNAHSGSHNHFNDRLESREEEEPGYFRQEIIGIGGRVKQKAKKRVTVGACVVEHEDERETGRYLVREEEELHRSWCGWCWRVIPAKHEAVDP